MAEKKKKETEAVDPVKQMLERLRKSVTDISSDEEEPAAPADTSLEEALARVMSATPARRTPPPAVVEEDIVEEVDEEPNQEYRTSI